MHFQAKITLDTCFLELLWLSKSNAKHFYNVKGKADLVKCLLASCMARNMTYLMQQGKSKSSCLENVLQFVQGPTLHPHSFRDSRVGEHACHKQSGQFWQHASVQGNQVLISFSHVA